MKSSKFNREYKALILDVDGTLINGRYALPSKKVTETIRKIKNKIHVGLATSRPIFILEEIISHLELSGPCIINAGASVIDPVSKKTLWKRPVLKKDAIMILKIAKELGFDVFFGNNKNHNNKNQINVSDSILQMWVPNLNPSQTDEFMNKISKISSIAKYSVPSWKETKMDIIITHAEATKQHGIWEVAKILNISTDDIIGVGDGYNDFPLLMACGLKVAMGNAVPELKEIADYIAPTVDKDGVADVINKFIL